jgi:hypothetical protein
MLTATMADVVVGTESWLDASVSSSEVFPRDYTVYRKDRNHGRGGGVFVLVSQKFNSEEPEELKVSEELLFVKLKVKGTKDLYVASYL